MAKLWARVGVKFEISDEKLKEVKDYIKGGHYTNAEKILNEALLDSYEFTGGNYIPDNEGCIAGCDELRDFDF